MLVTPPFVVPAGAYGPPTVRANNRPARAARFGPIGRGVLGKRRRPAGAAREARAASLVYILRLRPLGAMTFLGSYLLLPLSPAALPVPPPARWGCVPLTPKPLGFSERGCVSIRPALLSGTSPSK